MDDDTVAPSFPADVWSFGAVMLHCLTGRLPYEGERSIHKALLMGRLPFPIPDSLPPPLQKLLGQCFLEDPVQRPKLPDIKQVPPAT